MNYQDQFFTTGILNRVLVEFLFGWNFLSVLCLFCVCFVVGFCLFCWWGLGLVFCWDFFLTETRINSRKPFGLFLIFFILVYIIPLPLN